MTEPTPTSQPPVEKPRRPMPRPAIRAIAYSGFFLALTTLFIAYYGWRMHSGTALVALNLFTAVFLAVGSVWMLRQLRKTA